jgi:hypothetical protein
VAQRHNVDQLSIFLQRYSAASVLNFALKERRFSGMFWSPQNLPVSAVSRTSAFKHI